VKLKKHLVNKGELMNKIPYRIKKPFICTVYDKEPVKVANPYSGESITLTPEEIAIYDTIKGSELHGLSEIVRKGVDWFIKNNINAYSILLD